MRRAIGGLLALLALALACFLPLALEPRPVDWVAADAWVPLRALAVFGGLGAIVAWRAWLDAREGRSGCGTLALALFAGAMVFAHWVMFDRHPFKYDAGRQMYLDLLNHAGGVPHQYRLAPYGFTRLLERLLGDGWLAWVAYRWFFNFWLCWAWVRLVGCFTSQGRALASILVLVPLYPASVSWYLGQLTDPMSHALFILGLLWIVEGCFLPLLAALVLGLFAKETSVVLVPAYLAYHLGEGWRAWGKTILLGLAAVLAFLAARGLGWRPDFQALNGTTGWMIGTNLGIGEPIAETAVPFYHNYLHPLLFTLPFLPGVLLHGGRHERRLWAMTLVVVSAILASSLCFSWLYESRNYVPFLPLLLALGQKSSHHAPRDGSSPKE